MFGPRVCGRTTAIAEAAKKIGALVVCAHHRHARFVNSEHGVETTSIDTLERATIGMRTPVIWDHYAAECLYLENESFKAANKRMRDEVESYKSANERLRKEILTMTTKKQQAMDALQQALDTVTAVGECQIMWTLRDAPTGHMGALTIEDLAGAMFDHGLEIRLHMAPAPKESEE